MGNFFLPKGVKTLFGRKIAEGCWGKRILLGVHAFCVKHNEDISIPLYRILKAYGMMKRKVIGIGETIYDILFKNGQPTTAVPGGSVFNGIVSLGRMGVAVDFISETGNDRIGQAILAFMKENGVATEHVNVFPEGKSPVSLAFLNEKNEADYLFYKDYPSQRLDVVFPEIHPDDVVMFGSYFALNPVLRGKVSEFLIYAKERGAILYYDVNFRRTHAADAIKLTSTIIENMEWADIVRGSAEDFRYMFGIDSPEKVYTDKVKFYCPRMICTDGAGDVLLRADGLAKTYPVPRVETVSTVGAGDNFNAGIVYGLLAENIRRKDIPVLTESSWDTVLQCALDFSSEACRNLGNSVSAAFASSYRK